MDYLTKCRVCGKDVDTREKNEGGDSEGSEFPDGTWACSSACWEKVATCLTKKWRKYSLSRTILRGPSPQRIVRESEVLDGEIYDCICGGTEQQGHSLTCILRRSAPMKPGWVKLNQLGRFEADTLPKGRHVGVSMITDESHFLKDSEEKDESEMSKEFNDLRIVEIGDSLSHRVGDILNPFRSYGEAVHSVAERPDGTMWLLDEDEPDATQINFCPFTGRRAQTPLDERGKSTTMTVIDPDQWESCSPDYIASGRSCGDEPRVWNDVEKNHYHPKLK